METLIIENNNPNQLGNLIIILIAVFVVTSAVRLVFLVRRKKKLEKMLHQIKTEKEEAKND